MLKINGIDHQQLLYNVLKDEDGFYHRNKRLYLRAANHHIFVDPTYVNREDVPELLDKIAKRGSQHVHIFLTMRYGDMIERLVEFIGFLNRIPETAPKIFIHVPAKVPFLARTIDRSLNGIKAKYKVVTEGATVSFLGSWNYADGRRYSIDMTFTNGGLDINMGMAHYSFPNSIHKLLQQDEKKRPDGPLTDPKLLENMDQFKDKIIAGFKAACPPGILKGFKDDEDIWKYINNGEVTVKVEGEEENDKTP